MGGFAWAGMLGGGRLRPSAVTQQRARRPGATSASGGRSSPQREMRQGQRGMKRQPFGMASGSGGMPSMPGKRSATGASSRGTALASAQA